MTAPLTPPTRRARLTCGDVSLQVYEWGDEEAPPLVLVHGIEDFALTLSTLAEAFCDRYRVVAFDQRGHGDSDKPGIYSLPHYQADLHGVLEGLALEHPILVGHSLGGQVVEQYAGLFDERPRAVVAIEGLGPPFRFRDMPPELRQGRSRRAIEQLLEGGRGRRSMADLDEAIGLFRRYHPHLRPELSRVFVELGTEKAPEGGLRWKWDPRVQTTWLSVHPQVSEEIWGWIRCPVLQVTAGDAAQFWSRRRGVPREAARLHPDELARRLALFARARRVEHVEIAGAGHMVHYDEPDALTEAMQSFLLPPVGI